MENCNPYDATATSWLDILSDKMFLYNASIAERDNVMS